MHVMNTCYFCGKGMDVGDQAVIMDCGRIAHPGCVDDVDAAHEALEDFVQSGGTSLEDLKAGLR